MRKNIVFGILLAVPVFIYAENQLDSTKVRYNLFHPTPKSQMRSFEMDRPDVTESSYTVDAGHFQYEADLFKSEQTSDHGINTIQNSLNVFNIKLGITNSLDLQFVAETYAFTKVSGAVTSGTNSLFGNISFRLKQNIWGNDKGITSLAVLPFVNIPTLSSSKITGGIIVPFSMDLSNDWGMGAQVESDLESDQLGNGYHVNFLGTVTVSHPLFSKVEFFVESTVLRESELNSFDYSLNGGIIYEIMKDIKLDAGIYYGLKSTSTKSFFLGLSFRL